MSEWTLVWLVPIRIMIIAIFAFFYAVGGRGPKYVRRFVGAGWMIMACLLLSALTQSFSWKLITLGSLLGGLSMGYGGDTMEEKILRRLLFGVVVGGCGLLIGFSSGHLLLGLFQLIMAVLTSLFMGLINPTDAVDEEAIIASLSVFVIPFMV
jgi:hypothetical protein